MPASNFRQSPASISASRVTVLATSLEVRMAAMASSRVG